MSCPPIEQLAAGAAADHVTSCAACAALVGDHRAVGALARRLPPPVLPAHRRAALAAEILAAAEQAAPGARHRWVVATGLAVAAAVAVIWFARRAPTAPEPLAIRSVPVVAPVIAPVVPVIPPVITPIEPVAPSAAAIAGRADYTRSQVATRDTLRLRDGELTIDTRDRAPVAVIARDTTLAVANAKITVTAHGGVIVATRVFAGSVELTAAGARRVLETGELWTRPAEPERRVAPEPAKLEPPPDPVDAAPSSAATSLAAFRAGWEALRDGRAGDAIAAFDRATDPVVAEDAEFWAAVAADRVGDRDAPRRLRAFLDHFPASPHAEAARASLANLH